MANQQWVCLLNGGNPYSAGAGAALSSAATATISPVNGVASNPPDMAQVQAAGQSYGWYPGMLVRVTARGYLTTTGTSGTVTFFLASRVGNSGSTWVTLATAAALTTGTGSLAGLQWELDALSQCTAVAATGNTVSTQGNLTLVPVAAQTIPTGTADIVLSLPNASGVTAAAVDTTQLQGISMRCTQATSACTVQLTQWLVEALD
ncbi:MAG TPA: hypothetical protein VGG75_38400 [Trebonia sp.]|jgi:hypothetical protein